MLSQLLKDKGIDYESLNSAEQATLENWLQAVQQSELTPEKIRQHLELMRNGVVEELVTSEEPKHFWHVLHLNRRRAVLEARVRNYTMLIAFLSGPEKAKKALEEAIKRLQIT